MIRVFNALVTGLRRVLGAPTFVILLYVAGLVVAVPLALVMRGTLQDSFGTSLMEERMVEGFDMQWHGEFAQRAEGLGETFGPEVTGFLPVLGNLERYLDGTVLEMNGLVLLAGVVFLLAWAFLTGGIIDRYSQPMGATSPDRFYCQCGEHFFRFVRLQLLAVFCYWLVFKLMANPLHRWVESANRDTTNETTVMVHTFTVYAGVALVLVLLNMVFDYARISVVVERRFSVLLALVRGAGFGFSRFLWTFPLYLMLLFLAAIVFFGYALIAPGPGQSTAVAIFLAFVAGQIYIVARLMVKLWFLASQAVLFTSDERSGGL